MNRRSLKWSVLAFACLWFGMVLPVHQRGMIQLPGSAAAATHCKSADADGHCRKGKPSTPTPAERANCAVCHYIAGLHTPPPFTFAIAALGLVAVVEPDEPAVPSLLRLHLPIQGRGPPA